MKKVIYTANFGNYDNIYKINPPVGWDFIYFTDSDKKLLPDNSKIIISPNIYKDPNRSAKRFKILPHKYLSEYDISIWIDSNIILNGGNLDELIDKYLVNSNAAFFDHSKNNLDPRNCLYDEANVIFEFGRRNGNYKDDPNLIQNQINKYKLEGYPANNGLTTNMIIVRKHNELDVINTMEDWWTEIKYNSKRDQLSFNYIAWKNKFNFSYIDGDSRNNKWFKHMGKHKGKMKINNIYEPINKNYFLQMELQSGGGGKEFILNNYKLKTVNDVIEFWKKDLNIKQAIKELTPKNWQYFNAMMGGFRHGIEDHHKIGWESLTLEYFQSKREMTDEEIAKMLKENPVEFDNGFIRHGYHRACAMIGRLIQGKSYIPFYMKKDKIYDEPRNKDGVLRIKNPIYNINRIDGPERELGLPLSEFTICQSGILALMGIRKNDDLDIIISSEARKQLFENTDTEIHKNGVEIFAKNRGKFQIFDAQGDDDLIENYSFNVNGYNFLEPRFYFSRKNKKTSRDLKDWSGMKKFFDDKSYIGYPFNKISVQKWGIDYIK